MVPQLERPSHDHEAPVTASRVQARGVLIGLRRQPRAAQAIECAPQQPLRCRFARAAAPHRVWAIYSAYIQPRLCSLHHPVPTPHNLHTTPPGLQSNVLRRRAARTRSTSSASSRSPRCTPSTAASFLRSCLAQAPSARARLRSWRATFAMSCVARTLPPRRHPRTARTARCAAPRQFLHGIGVPSSCISSAPYVMRAVSLLARA